MITGERTIEISGNKSPNIPPKSMGIGIRLDDVKMAGENIEITYSFAADYGEAGKIMIKGALISQEDSKRSKEIVDNWKKNKQLPADFAESVLSAVNYSGCANGTLIARVLGLTAPLIPPKVQMPKKEVTTSKVSAKK